MEEEEELSSDEENKDESAANADNLQNLACTPEQSSHQIKEKGQPCLTPSKRA